MPLRGVDDLAVLISQRIPESIQEAAKGAITDGCDELVAMMKSRVPSDQGKLRDSIGWTFGDAPAGAVTVGTVADKKFGQIKATVYAGDETTMVYNSRGIPFQNAKLQQFGTRGGTPASDYFLGSWQVLKRRIRSRITRKVNAEIRRVYANG